MNNSFTNDKYWITGSILTILIIIFLYPLSPFKSFRMDISRSEAIEIAQDYLKKQGIDVSHMYKEGFVDENLVVNKYFLREFGSEGMDKFKEKENLKTFGWVVYFHENSPTNSAQTSYTIGLSNEGSVVRFEREIPDTTVIPSVSKDEASALITHTIQNNLNVNLDEYLLIKSDQHDLNKRTDYSFRWEKSVEDIEGKILVTAKVQGNEPGSYEIDFQVPEKYRTYFDTTEALFSTVSVIFVAFIMVFALYYFLKKYHQGEVWVNVGRSIFIVYFVAAIILLINAWPNIGMGVSMGTLSFLSVKIIVILINGLLIQFLLALLVFAAWAVGESFGRELWPDKLKGTDSILKGHIFAVAAGFSSLRGMVLGLGLGALYLVSSIILDNPGIALFISPVSNFDVFHGFIPLLSSIGGAFIDATLTGIVITFFTVNFAYSKKQKKSFAILMAGLITTFVNVIALTPPSVNSFGVNLIIYFCFGIFLGYIYFKFDLLTLLTMLFYAAITYDAYTLYAASAGFYNLNFVLLICAFFTVPIIYTVSRIKKEDFELKDYGLPSHVEKISERERLKKELEIAAKVQLSLLPKEQPQITGYDVASLSIPAKEAGGDYYDFVKLSNNKIGIAVGDVSGKGVGAAIYMTLTKGILQAHAEENVSPRIVLGKVNRLLYKTIEKNSFVSMFYAVLDTQNHSLLYSRAGHNPGIFCSFEKADSKMLMSKGIALGLEEGKVFQETLLEDTIELKQGDVVVLYTDGFTEAMNEKLEQFGERNLIDLVENNRDKSCSELLNLILKEVHKFTKGFPQHDDMTIVILKRK